MTSLVGLTLFSLTCLSGCVNTPETLDMDIPSYPTPDSNPPTMTFPGDDVGVMEELDMGPEADQNPLEDMTSEEDMGPNPDMNVDPMCQLPEEGQCSGDLLEKCVNDVLVTTDCAQQEQRCVSDLDGARCEDEPIEVDLCEGNYCDNRGYCDEGLCICDPGYTGAECETCDSGWQRNEFGNCEPLLSIFGTQGNDELVGSAAGEIIRGREGDDTIRGAGGDDYINGNAGNDFVNGNQGRDDVKGGSGDDELHGGADDDTVHGGAGHDYLDGDLGNDRLIGGDGDDQLFGGEGDDHYTLDGLGDDWIEDEEGTNTARCAEGIKIDQEAVENGNVVLHFNTGGTVSYPPGAISQIGGCTR